MNKSFYTKTTKEAAINCSAHWFLSLCMCKNKIEEREYWTIPSRPVVIIQHSGLKHLRFRLPPSKMNSMFARRVVVDSSSRLTKLLANPPYHHSFTSLYRPSQARHFRTPSPPASRFDPSLLWRSEKIRGFFASALTNKSAKLGNLVESKVAFLRSQFPRKGFELGGYSGRRGWYCPSSSSYKRLIVSWERIKKVSIFFVCCCCCYLWQEALASRIVI